MKYAHFTSFFVVHIKPYCTLNLLLLDFKLPFLDFRHSQLPILDFKCLEIAHFSNFNQEKKAKSIILDILDQAYKIVWFFLCQCPFEGFQL